MDDIEGARDELMTEIAPVAGALLSDDSLEETRRQVVSTAVATIDGCDSAGVFVIDGKG